MCPQPALGTSREGIAQGRRMILLHPNLGDDFVEFLEYSQIVNRPNFCPDVDSTKVQLVKPIGAYRFREKVKCGLKDCHQPHHKGLVVHTSDGHEVNIGGYCGRTHFGESFSVLFNLAQRFEARRHHVQKVRELKAIGSRLLAQIDAFIDAPDGGRWMNRMGRRLRELLPGDAVQALTSIARRGEAEVFEEIHASDRDAELQRVMGVRSSWNTWHSRRDDPVVKQESRGHLVGLRAFVDDPGTALYSLRGDLERVLALEPINCKPKDVRAAADFAVGVESRIAELERLLHAGRRFYTYDNLRLLRYLPRLFRSTRTELEQFDPYRVIGTAKGNRAA
jgi:hypothetical protein